MFIIAGRKEKKSGFILLPVASAFILWVNCPEMRSQIEWFYRHHQRISALFQSLLLTAGGYPSGLDTIFACCVRLTGAGFVVFYPPLTIGFLADLTGNNQFSLQK